MSTQPPETADPPSAPIANVHFVRRDGGRLGAIASALSVCAWLFVEFCAFVGGGMPSPPTLLVLLLTGLPYLTIAGLLWLCVLWTLTPDRRAPPLLLGITLLGATLRWGPSPPIAVADGEPVRVMSWNVRRLWGGAADGGDPARCVAEAIREAAPDVLTLLEVSERDVSVLSQRLGLRCVHTTYRGGVGVTRGGLASCVYGDDWKISGKSYRFSGEDRWYYVFTELEKRGQVFNLLSVHLRPHWFSTTRMANGVSRLFSGEVAPLVGLGRSGREVVSEQSDQAAALLRRVARFKDPTVLAGDFNSTRDLSLHAELREPLTDTWERAGVGLGGTVFVGGLLPLRVDYIYSSDAFGVKDARVLPIDCSDHRPVVADLVLSGGQRVDGVH